MPRLQVLVEYRAELQTFRREKAVEATAQPALPSIWNRCPNQVPIPGGHALERADSGTGW
jgi:hypothetical protein